MQYKILFYIIGAFICNFFQYEVNIEPLYFIGSIPMIAILGSNKTNLTDICLVLGNVSYLMFKDIELKLKLITWFKYCPSRIYCEFKAKYLPPRTDDKLLEFPFARISHGLFTHCSVTPHLAAPLFTVACRRFPFLSRCLFLTICTCFTGRDSFQVTI